MCVAIYQNIHTYCICSGNHLAAITGCPIKRVSESYENIEVV